MNIDNILILFAVLVVIVGLFRIACSKSKREVWLVMGRDCKKDILYVAGVFDNHDGAWKYCHKCSTMIVDDVFYLEKDLLNGPLGDEKIVLGKRRFFINGEMMTIDVRVE